LPTLRSGHGSSKILLRIFLLMIRRQKPTRAFPRTNPSSTGSIGRGFRPIPIHTTSIKAVDGHPGKCHWTTNGSWSATRDYLRQTMTRRDFGERPQARQLYPHPGG
jgi:hypothetical protein